LLNTLTTRESTASLSEHSARLRRRLEGPSIALFVLVTAYVVVLGWLTLHQQARFGTFGFDMGIHDQGIWLLSRGERPFVTVRRLHNLGHHLNLVSLLFVPAYWLGAGPSFLYLVETMFLGLGAVPVYLLARDVIGGRWIPLVPAVAYLLHPTLSWINWWHFHPEALAIAPLLFALWFARRERWLWFACCIAFVLTTKEDLALAVFALGVVLAVATRRTSWRPGAITAAVGLAWYVLALQVVMPWFHGGGEAAHYVQELYPRFGDDAPSIVVGIVTDPATTFGLLTDSDRIAYYARLLAPAGFVGLLGLPWLVITGPQVAANALSSLSTTYDARYHYSVVPVAVVAIAVVHGLGRLRRFGPVARNVGLAVVLGCSIVTHVAWGITPLGRPFGAGYWVREPVRLATFERAMAAVPEDASVAATYYFVPHLTHRRTIYEWPNPWVPGNWGFANRDPDDPSGVDYLVIDTFEGQEGTLLDSLRASEFVETVFEENGVVVAKRPAR
jgi:uncharacterized membrane protein